VHLLPEKYRAVFLLRDLQQLTTAETVQLLGINKANVKMRLSRAQLQMRDALASLSYLDEMRRGAGLVALKSLNSMGLLALGSGSVERRLPSRLIGSVQNCRDVIGCFSQIKNSQPAFNYLSRPL
jgi:hypothetical protein